MTSEIKAVINQSGNGPQTYVLMCTIWMSGKLNEWRHSPRPRHPGHVTLWYVHACCLQLAAQFKNISHEMIINYQQYRMPVGGMVFGVALMLLHSTWVINTLAWYWLVCHCFPDPGGGLPVGLWPGIIQVSRSRWMYSFNTRKGFTHPTGHASRLGKKKKCGKTKTKVGDRGDTRKMR